MCLLLFQNTKPAAKVLKHVYFLSQNAKGAIEVPNCVIFNSIPPNMYNVLNLPKHVLTLRIKTLP